MPVMALILCTASLQKKNASFFSSLITNVNSTCDLKFSPFQLIHHLKSIFDFLNNYVNVQNLKEDVYFFSQNRANFSKSEKYFKCTFIYASLSSKSE